MIEIEEIPVEKIEGFWKIHYAYLINDGIITDEEDKEYFQSEEYRGIILRNMLRAEDKHHIVYFVRGGVRIGAATVKGLAFAQNKSCIGVSTLEAIAENLSVCRGLICPVMNARRSQVYTALFRSDGKALTRLLPDSAMAISELDGILAEYGEPVFFCGDGYEITLANLCKTKAEYVPERLRHQSAFSVAVVALREFEGGKAGSDSSLSVNYLRPSQAERERNERLSKEKVIN